MDLNFGGLTISTGTDQRVVSSQVNDTGSFLATSLATSQSSEEADWAAANNNFELFCDESFDEDDFLNSLSRKTTSLVTFQSKRKLDEPEPRTATLKEVYDLFEAHLMEVSIRKSCQPYRISKNSRAIRSTGNNELGNSNMSQCWTLFIPKTSSPLTRTVISRKCDGLTYASDPIRVDFCGELAHSAELSPNYCLAEDLVREAQKKIDYKRQLAAEVLKRSRKPSINCMDMVVDEALLPEHQDQKMVETPLHTRFHILSMLARLQNREIYQEFFDYHATSTKGIDDITETEVLSWWVSQGKELFLRAMHS